MRNRKRQIRYIPGLRSYIRKEHKTNNYKRRYGYDFQNNYNKLSILLIVIGAILIAIGTIGIFQNTIVYSPLKFFGSSKGGVSFVTSTILLFIGMVAIVLKRKHILGGILMLLGITSIVLSIFFSLKMSLLPISLLKAILIFGSIFVGVALIVKGILEFIRK
ncbi:hypothetical protein [uncultured Clostridium sp.]|uniref:hypothetical protein n=1 Tax=uncultured Clostridium sp. TaxID=59620 RepID=UPI0025F21647|nr:hypothetical protein [uncultured Clostridium sp.]